MWICVHGVYPIRIIVAAVVIENCGVVIVGADIVVSFMMIISSIITMGVFF